MTSIQIVLIFYRVLNLLLLVKTSFIMDVFRQWLLMRLQLTRFFCWFQRVISLQLLF